MVATSEGKLAMKFEPYEYYATVTFLVRIANDALKYRKDELMKRPDDMRNYRMAKMLMEKLGVPENEIEGEEDEVEEGK